MRWQFINVPPHSLALSCLYVVGVELWRTGLKPVIIRRVTQVSDSRAARGYHCLHEPSQTMDFSCCAGTRSRVAT